MIGAQFEIRIDGTPRSYRDRKDYAMEGTRRLHVMALSRGKLGSWQV
jgi:hypothetical protein